VRNGCNVIWIIAMLATIFDVVTEVQKAKEKHRTRCRCNGTRLGMKM